MKLPNEITLNIKGKIRILLISFYKEDTAVDTFIQVFQNSIEKRDRIVDVKKYSDIKELITFFEKCTKEYTYNTVLFVSHGKVTGDPTIQEETSYPDNPVAEIIQGWAFLSNCFYDALIDKLLILAICHSGKELSLRILSRGHPQALHIVTPAEGNPLLDACIGAKAIAYFLNTLINYNILEYWPEHLRQAEIETINEYPNTIKLWLYGEDF